MNRQTYLGIDLGSSGCRTTLIDSDGGIVAEHSLPLPPESDHHSDGRHEQVTQRWWETLLATVDALATKASLENLAAIALDSTSGTLLVTDEGGAPITAALMYDDKRATAEAKCITTVAPPESAAHGTGSALAKWLWFIDQGLDGYPHTPSDWLSGMLCGRFDRCDSNNALKLGYDALAHDWPEWLDELGLDRGRLPDVVEAGSPIGRLTPELIQRWSANPATVVCSGTTDATAAFIASGAARPGEAVTSLGTTLVLKVVADKPIFAPEYGVYSQPFGNLWLIGGGSNSGGGVLRHFFSDEQMVAMSGQIDPDSDSGLDYYPLLTPGERFPVNNPDLAPRLEPRPADDTIFFHGLLEGIAHIEQQGYQLLEQLGAPRATTICTNGGGAKNRLWRQMRQRVLGIEIIDTASEQAAYGSALLARKGLSA